VNSNTGGEYLLRPLQSGSDWGFHPYFGLNSTYQGYVNSPTINGVVLVRILVKNNSTDLPLAQDLLAQCNLTTIPRKETLGSPLTNSTFSSFSADVPTSTLTLLAILGQENGPFNVTHKEASHVQRTLVAAGIRNGSYTQPSGVNITKAYDLTLTALSAASTNRILKNVTNGWTEIVPQGLYSSDYLARDLAADLIYLQQVPAQALYPFPATSSMILASNESIIYSFSSKPPLAPGGFWSLTLYNAEGFLVANALNRYSVGDRSNITFADGTQVYDSSSVDGQFQVLVQPVDVNPPTNWANKYITSFFSPL
jgi:hypothetical protein